MRTMVLIVALLAACGGPGRPPIFGPQATPRRAPVTAETVFVSCMSEPPKFVDIDWPTPDRMGNRILHASTVDRVQKAYADLRKYATENYFRCLHVAEERGEQAVTVETEP